MTMTTPITFNPKMVYRVVLETDVEPHARLAIGPVGEENYVRFFDTLRQRVIHGEITGPSAKASDTICFTQENGMALMFEPLTLERYLEIVDQIDGQPMFQSTDEVQSFYLKFAGLE